MIASGIIKLASIKSDIQSWTDWMDLPDPFPTAISLNKCYRIEGPRFSWKKRKMYVKLTYFSNGKAELTNKFYL